MAGHKKKEKIAHALTLQHCTNSIPVAESLCMVKVYHSITYSKRPTLLAKVNAVRPSSH